jgi:hypothetical protein
VRERLGANTHSSRQVQERRAKIEAIYREARKKSQEWIAKTWDEKPISQARFFSEINKRVQGKSWALVSSHGRRWREAIEVTEPAHGMGGGRRGGVGYGLPSSIGAALGFKETGRLCVSILGDGDFLMTSNSLWTAAKYQIPLLVVVLNNRSYYRCTNPVCRPTCISKIFHSTIGALDLFELLRCFLCHNLIKAPDRALAYPLRNPSPGSPPEKGKLREIGGRKATGPELFGIAGLPNEERYLTGSRSD